MSEKFISKISNFSRIALAKRVGNPSATAFRMFRKFWLKGDSLLMDFFIKDGGLRSYFRANPTGKH
jgi:hypothetical protein